MSEMTDLLMARAENAWSTGDYNAFKKAAEVIKAQRQSLREMSQLLRDLDLGRGIHNSRFPDKEIDGPLWAQISRVTAVADECLEMTK